MPDDADRGAPGAKYDAAIAQNDADPPSERRLFAAPGVSTSS